MHEENLASKVSPSQSSNEGENQSVYVKGILNDGEDREVEIGG